MAAERTVRIGTVALWDLATLGLLYLVPTLSHLTSIPFYRFEPMRCVLLLCLLFTGSKKNAYIMALTLPLFSFLAGGHPVLAKALLMAFELSANVLIFNILSRKVQGLTIRGDGGGGDSGDCGGSGGGGSAIRCSAGWSGAIAMLLSIAASKALYYAVKFGCLSLGLLDGPMVATGLPTQLVVAVVLSLAFWAFKEKV